jgi:hypothetical protein
MVFRRVCGRMARLVCSFGAPVPQLEADKLDPSPQLTGASAPVRAIDA